MTGKRVVGCIVLTCLLTMMFPLATSAQRSFPSRPIEIVVPAGAGGGLDTCARFFADKMKDLVSVPVRVTNVPGGAHTKGIMYSYSAPADGHTIHALSPSDIIADVFKKLSFKFTEEFVPLCRVQHDTALICVSSKSKFKTMKDLISFAKANPGKVTWGGLSPGGIDDAICGLICKQAGIKITFVPHESSGALNAAVLGGHVDVMQGEPVEALELIKAGDFRPLLVLAEQRVTGVPELRDVPTGREIGLDVTLGTWRGFAVKKGTPEDVIKYLVSIFEKIYNSPEYKKFVHENVGDLRPGWMGPVEFGELWKDEVRLYTEMFTELGRIQ